MALWMFNNMTTESLGIIGSPVIERRNQDVDVCRIVLRKDIDIASPFAHEQRVVVTRDSTAVFTGFAQAPRLNGSAGNETHTVEILGPWWKLERLILVQPPPTFGLIVGAANLTGRRRMFIGTTDGRHLTTREMLTEVLDYAVNKGAIPSWSGILDVEDGVKPVGEEIADRSVAEILRNILRYHVDVATAFLGTQQLRLRRRGAHSRSFALGAPPLTDVRVRQRRDLIPAGVHIRYELRGNFQSMGAYKDPITVDRWPQNVVPGQIGVISETVQLEEGEAVPQRIAKRFYDQFALPPIIEGEIEFTAAECTTDIFPGSSIWITKTASSTLVANAFVRSVKEDTNTGATSVEVGLPDHMGLDRWIDLIRQRHRRHRDDTDGDPLRLEIPSTSLTPYLVLTEGGRYALRVTDGSVSDGAEEHTPKWEGTGLQLDDAEPPERVLPFGFNFDVWLLIEFRPTARQYTLQTNDGFAVQEWAADEEGEITRVSIQFAKFNERVASVDPLSGAIVEGRWFRKLGRVTWGQGIPVLSQRKIGSFQIVHRPPSRLLYIPSTSDA
jgi:hypothetical protein